MTNRIAGDDFLSRTLTRGFDMAEEFSNAFTLRSASMIRHLRRVTRMLLPYRHELAALAKQLGCDDKPFRCWLEIERLKERAAKADKYKRDAENVRASFQAELRKENGHLIDGLRAANEALEARESHDKAARAAWVGLGFSPDRAPKGADLVVWLMSELEAAKARLETEKAATRAFQAGIVDLISVSRSLRARVEELEAPTADAA